MQVSIHFDPGCPWTWITSRWLLRAAELEQLEIRWEPFSLVYLTIRDGDEIPEKQRTRAAVNTAALRVVQHLVAVEDNDGIGRFYDELGDRLHRKGMRASLDLVRDAVEAANVDAGSVGAMDDESLDQPIAVLTELAYESAGPDVGSPVLHWEDDRGQDVWIFGPLYDHVPDAACSAELWRGVRAMAVHDMFKELKRGRKSGPDVASS